MLVRAIQEYVPYVGKLGATKEMPAHQARVLIKLKKVEAVVDEPEDERPQTYSRRDMRAEDPEKPKRQRRVKTTET